jgi:hypothetical protein
MRGSILPVTIAVASRSLSDRQPIQPDVRETVHLSLDARDETAAQAKRTMEFAGASKGAHARGIECRRDVVAEMRLDRASVPGDGDGAILLSLRSHGIPAERLPIDPSTIVANPQLCHRLRRAAIGWRP